MSNNPQINNQAEHLWLVDCAAACAAHLHDKGRSDLEKIERYRRGLEIALTATPASSVEEICNYTTNIKTLTGKYLHALFKSIRTVMAHRMGIEADKLFTIRFSALSVEDGKLVSFNLASKDKNLGAKEKGMKVKRTMIAYDTILRSLSDRTVTSGIALKVIILLDAWYNINSHAPKNFLTTAEIFCETESCFRGEEFIPSEREKGDESSKT